MDFKRMTRALACVVALALTVTAPARPLDDQAWQTERESWYILELAGGRAGWMHEVIQTDGERFRSENTAEMKIGRGATPVEVNTRSTFIETVDGKPLELEYMQKMSLQPVHIRWVFADDHVKELTTKGGREIETKKPLPEGAWLTPMAIDRLLKQRSKDGADAIEYRTLNPEGGLELIKVTARRAGQEQYEHDGTSMNVTVWNSTATLKSALGEIKIESVEKIADDGNSVCSETSLMGLGKLITRLASREDAIAHVGEGPELLTRTLITPSKPIENSMKATSATLGLTAKDGKLPAMPSAGAQRVEMSEDGKTAVLTININDNLPASGDEIGDEDYTNANTMVDFEDALVTKLAGAAKDEVTAMDKAIKLRQIAHDRISKKGMATAFACASETAKTRTGDCSEHGVLLCALLRAQGIPARVAMGLVYVDQFMGGKGVFGWHMWTQALIDGKWVDLDATLPVRYNAAHVLTNTSSLASGLGASDMASMLQLIGNMDVEVIEVGYD